MGLFVVVSPFLTGTFGWKSGILGPFFLTTGLGLASFAPPIYEAKLDARTLPVAGLVILGLCLGGLNVLFLNGSLL